MPIKFGKHSVEFLTALPAHIACNHSECVSDVINLRRVSTLYCSFLLTVKYNSVHTSALGMTPADISTY